jgi:hypothetical protein
MKKQFLKLGFLIFCIVLAYSWFFGALRFQWEPAAIIYSILNFPFGFINLILEKHFWITYGPSHWINNEITGVIFWILSIVLQSSLFLFIIWKIKSHKQKRKTIMS